MATLWNPIKIYKVVIQFSSENLWCNYVWHLMMLWSEYSIPGSRTLKEVNPFWGIKELQSERNQLINWYCCPNIIWMINYKLKIRSKILVCKSRPIVFLHEIHYVRLYPVWALPEAPKPLGAEAWHSIYAKVDKDAHLGLIIPLQHLLYCWPPKYYKARKAIFLYQAYPWKRSCIQAFPCWLIPHRVMNR